jgi:hypothetical protein
VCEAHLSLAIVLRSLAVVLVLLMSTGPAAAQEFSTFSNRGKGVHSTRFTAGEYSCTVDVIGNGTCTPPSGHAWKFTLPPESPDADMEMLCAIENGEGMLILLEFDDSDSGWGRIARLRRGASRPEWTHQLQSFNLVAPVRVGDDIFLAGIAFAARLNARTGRFIWRHTGRYKTGDMDVPQGLEISHGRVVVRGTAGGKQKTDCFATATGAVMACQ